MYDYTQVGTNETFWSFLMVGGPLLLAYLAYINHSSRNNRRNKCSELGLHLFVDHDLLTYTDADDELLPSHTGFCYRTNVEGVVNTLCKSLQFTPDESKLVPSQWRVLTATVKSKKTIQQVDLGKGEMNVGNEIGSYPWLCLHGIEIESSDKELYLIDTEGKILSIKLDGRNIIRVNESTGVSVLVDDNDFSENDNQECTGVESISQLFN